MDTSIDLKKVLADHKAWVESGRQSGVRANLTSAYLTGANLTSANLTSANLADANLIGANLRGANLRDANLRDANLRGANLIGANLTSANLRGANLRDANLASANLTDANLTDANLIGANLIGANLTGANLRDTVGIIDMGCPNGYKAFAYLGPQNVVLVRVGCQQKTIKEGREYWSSPDHHDLQNRREVLLAIDYAEGVAKLRCWRTE